MTDLRKAAEMALEALEEYTCVVQSGTDPNKWHEVVDGGKPAREAIKALHQALAQPEQEPVAFVTGYFGGHLTITCFDPALVLPDGLALYTAPPKREWVGLTDEERFSKDWQETVARVEAKLKEKNT